MSQSTAGDGDGEMSQDEEPKPVRIELGSARYTRRNLDERPGQVEASCESSPDQQSPRAGTEAGHTCRNNGLEQCDRREEPRLLPRHPRQIQQEAHEQRTPRNRLLTRLDLPPEPRHER